jgi:hypothetical protein
MPEFVPTHLTLWKRPDCYAGPDWSNWCTIVTRHRDSDILGESNWECAVDILETAANRVGQRRCTLNIDPPWISNVAGKSDTREPVRCIQTATDSHWAVGWCEALRVHKDSPPSILRAADDIRRRLADYPILDESDYSKREWSYATELWESLDIRGRAFYIGKANKHGESISVFAARRARLPDSDCGELFQMLVRE